MFAWRPMTAADLDTVNRIAGAVHAAYPEDPVVFAERLNLYSKGCFVAANAENAVCDGYCIAHPWRLGRIPALNTLLGEIPRDADCLYVHDVAILPATRKAGLGVQVSDLLKRVAGSEGFRRLALTSVHNSQPFWERQGYRRVTTPELTRGPQSYGDDAAYMVCALA